MPLIDNTTVLNGFSQSITDWMCGDDRILSGDVALSTNPPPSSDQNLSDAYFTLKLNPNDTDANAIVQLHITQTVQNFGYISLDVNSVYTSLMFHVFSEMYESYVDPGTVYYWDIRCITQSGGTTFTVASGTVVFLQNVTQTNVAGTPAALPNNGQPQFRGFFFQNPMVAGFNFVANLGDWAMNGNPANGQGIGWSCIYGGSVGTANWLSWTLPINYPNPDFHFKGYATGPPVSGTYVAADYFLNSVPNPNMPEGWECVSPGSPGTWKTKGIIGS
jgi:hypothetical protein